MKPHLLTIACSLVAMATAMTACGDSDIIEIPDGGTSDGGTSDSDTSDGGTSDGEPYPGYTLFAPIASTTTYLVDLDGNVVHQWEGSYSPGQSVRLLEDGTLLRTAAITPDDEFLNNSGGRGGRVEIVDWDGTVLWSVNYSSETTLQHHDAIVLPSGNILLVAWEMKTSDEAAALGSTNETSTTVWADAIVEICRNSDGSNTCKDQEVVWSWSVWDHIVQDDDVKLGNYVESVADYPGKIDVNYYTRTKDTTHINSVDYDPDTDRILVSVHNYGEIWILDHSIADTTGEGGELIARYGNPEAWGQTGEQTLFGLHDAQWIKDDLPGKGHILVFNNGPQRPDGNYSSVDELCDPTETCPEGELINSYSEGPDGDFYAENISGAQRLPNGNTLVCNGPAGIIFEVTSAGEKVWEYDITSVGGLNGKRAVFRAYRYGVDYAGLAKLDL